jgi:uncharacterized protein (DUF1697 family)
VAAARRQSRAKHQPEPPQSQSDAACSQSQRLSALTGADSLAAWQVYNWEDEEMATYVAFLRGVNLGPNNKISMPALRAMAEDLGYTDVATYINSGNLIVTSPKKAATLEREISKAIKDRFGRPIDVTVRTPAQLKKILADNPYPDGNPSQVTIAFLTKVPAADAKDKVAAVAKDHEPFVISGQQVYVNYSQGIGRSKLAEKFSDIIGVSATVRNIRTIDKVLALCGD